MIVLKCMTKHYGELEALSELSLGVCPGEIYALLGPNGAGKTTALRCLATLLKPNSGTASVGGADVLQNPLRARSRIGFLASSMGLYERLSARAFLSLVEESGHKPIGPDVGERLVRSETGGLG